MKSQPLDEHAVDLHLEVFGVESPFPIYRYRYDQEDLTLAMETPFKPAEELTTNQPRTKLVWQFWTCLVVILVCITYLTWQSLPADRLKPWYLVPLISACLLPFLLIYASLKWAALSQRRTNKREIPDHVIELRLTESGWAIGDRHGVSLNHWRETTGIFHNRDFIGFRSINLLLSLIPKRAFPDLAVADRFLAQSMDLKQQAEIPTAILVESGNPYQAPLGK